MRLPCLEGGDRTGQVHVQPSSPEIDKLAKRLRGTRIVVGAQPREGDL